MRALIRIQRWAKDWQIALAILFVLCCVFAALLLARNDWVTNVGFLVVGALIAVITTLLSERFKRETLSRDLARSLYLELADRVARCCWDSETPWSAWLDLNYCQANEVDSFRLRKFLPDRPIIFEASASQLAILGGEAPQAMLKFYYRLAAWRRDLDNIAAQSDRGDGKVDPKTVNFLAKRLYQTLMPGLRALEAMQTSVEDHEQIEASALAGYVDYSMTTHPPGSLREKLMRVAIEKHAN
jgi:hypothetical protein